MHTRHCSSPKVCSEVFKKKLHHLVEIGILDLDGKLVLTTLDMQISRAWRTTEVGARIIYYQGIHTFHTIILYLI